MSYCGRKSTDCLFEQSLVASIATAADVVADFKHNWVAMSPAGGHWRLVLRPSPAFPGYEYQDQLRAPDLKLWGK